VKLRVELVDFAGQVEYYIGHQIFLSDIQCLYVVMAEYGQKKHGFMSWLPFLKSMFSSKTRVPAMLVCSKVPTASSNLTGRCGELLQDYIPPFELSPGGAAADARMVLYELEDGKYEDSRIGPSRMKEEVMRRLKEISQSSRVPASYNKAIDAMMEWLRQESKESGGKIVRREELVDRIKKQEERLADDPGLVVRALQYMKGGGLISYSSEDSEWVVLEPLSWLPRLLALFVQSSDAMKETAAIPADELGFVELTGADYDTLIESLQLGSRAEADQALQLLESYGLAHRDKKNPNRLYLPFTLKPTADWLVKPHELNGARVLGRRWKCGLGTAFPPGFFCQLQLKAVGRADGSSSNPGLSLKQYPRHSNNIRFRDDKNNIGEILYSPEVKEMRMVVWGQSPVPLLQALVAFIDHHIRLYPGLSDEAMERWPLCPKCMDSKCRPICEALETKLIGVRVEVKSDSPEAQYTTEWTLPNAEQCHHDHVSIKELLTEGCKFVFCSFSLFCFLYFLSNAKLPCNRCTSNTCRRSESGST